MQRFQRFVRPDGPSHCDGRGHSPQTALADGISPATAPALVSVASNDRVAVAWDQDAGAVASCPSTQYRVVVAGVGTGVYQSSGGLTILVP